MLGAEFQQATVVGLLVVVLVWRQVMLSKRRQVVQMSGAFKLRRVHGAVLLCSACSHRSLFGAYTFQFTISG